MRPLRNSENEACLTDEEIDAVIDVLADLCRETLHQEFAIQKGMRCELNKSI